MSTNNARASGKTVKRKKVGVDLSLGLQVRAQTKCFCSAQPIKS